MFNLLNKNFGVYAGVVELVDTPGLGPGAFGRGGSSPLSGTIKLGRIAQLVRALR